MAANDLQTALLSAVGFETKTDTVTDRQIRLLGRVQAEGMATWLVLLESLLRVSGDSKLWTFDVSKQYFLRGNKLLYGWRLIFQGESLSQVMPEILALVRSAKPVQSLVDIPLHASPNRNALKNGKGAQAASFSRESGPTRGGS